MVSPASLRPSAPSASLLRFLRLQSDAYYSSTHHHHQNTPAFPRCRNQRRTFSAQCQLSIGDVQKGSRVPRGTTPPCMVALEASLFPPQGLRLKRLRYIYDPSNSKRNPAYQTSRSFSASSKKSRNLFRRLLGLERQPVQEKLRPDDLPVNQTVEDGYEGNMFNIGRGLAAKASNEPRLRCTELDGNGNVTLVNGEFKKTELIAKYGLLPRDLRKIDSSVLPHILVRHSAILISLLHLRVLIKADRVLVFDAYGSADSYIQSLFMYDLEGKLRQKVPSAPGALPYEFRALEAVLVSVTSGLEAEFEGVREPVVRVLRALEEDIDRDKLRHLLIYSKRLGTFEQKARLVRDAIEDLLEADDDLTAMYLTERAKGIHRAEHDHQEVEMLLESYHKVCDEIVQASGNLVTSIRNTEEVVKAILDANRNSLMLLDLKFSIGTLGLAAGTLFSALYGMNLKNFIEESDIGFAAVSSTCFLFTAFVCAYGLMKLRKVQRVRMWGEGGIQDRYATGLGTQGIPPSVARANWRSDSLNPVWTSFPGEERLRRARLERAAAASSSSAALSAGRTTAANAYKGNKELHRPSRLAEINVESRPRTDAAEANACAEESRNREEESAVAAAAAAAAAQEGAAAMASTR
ncbi:hypothetical protein VTO42DRAFT_8384 [Malbranchea cinnamomea]